MKNHSIQIERSKQRLIWKSLLSFNMQEISTDWFSKKLESPYKYVIAVDSDRLYFLGKYNSAPWCQTHHKQGQFVEKLRDFDVVELFLLSGDRYQEFNVSPVGAWWVCTFSGYRKAESVPQPIKSVDIFSEIDSSGWRAGFSIDLKDISVGWGETQPLISVTSIIGNPQIFIASNPVPGIKPDFHHKRNFVKGQFRDIA